MQMFGRSTLVPQDNNGSRAIDSVLEAGGLDYKRIGISFFTLIRSQDGCKNFLTHCLHEEKSA